MAGSSGSWHETSACTCTSIARTLDRSITPPPSGQHFRAGLLRLLDLRRAIALYRNVAPCLHRRAPAHERQPALQTLEFIDADPGPVVSRDPWPQRHVGNGIIAGDVFVTGELPVEHTEE